MRTYRGILGLAALSVIGAGATIVLSGGWQSAGAALAALSGIGSAAGLAVFLAAGERSRRRRPAWSEHISPPAHRTREERAVPVSRSRSQPPVEVPPREAASPRAGMRPAAPRAS
jgi:hypothetical protein